MDYKGVELAFSDFLLSEAVPRVSDDQHLDIVVRAKQQLGAAFDISIQNRRTRGLDTDKLTRMRNAIMKSSGSD